MLTAEEIRLRTCISRIAVASLAQNAFSALAVHAAVLLGRHRGRPSTAGGWLQRAAPPNPTLQILSAKVRSIRRKYQTPLMNRSDVTPRLTINPGRKIGDRPPEIAQRKPSITPTIGFSE